MNNKFPKINIREFLSVFFDRDSEKIDPSPRTDWVVIISSFFFLSVAFFVFYHFMFLSQESILTTTNNTINNEISIENISKTKLDKTLTPWREREAIFNNYYNNRPTEIKGNVILPPGGAVLLKENGIPVILPGVLQDIKNSFSSTTEFLPIIPSLQPPVPFVND
ncbi:MAG: hypothetical protein UT05_C0003G0015 [Parcubacteria group bacterium GW2011_GWF2_38_76]|nr:MAG: hypothetical protein UT05_C0003G0015 [Parcubacteria group bacterium GW2011_GWF2_38_76]HBM46211.1 hypothetical protein [Patescibacteria group bacterium]